MTASNAGADVVLVKDGQAQSRIVLADRPSEQARQAAQVLQEYIERISGAKLAVVSEKEAAPGSRIFIGQSDAVRAMGLKAPSGFTREMNEEGFILKTVGSDLVMAGNEDRHYRGTIYAVYDFLDRLGCRWFFPGEYGEVVPKKATLSVGRLDVESRPSFRFRNIWYSGWMPAGPEDQAKLAKWYDCNKAHALSGLSLPGDGTVIRLAPPEKYYDSLPQIYALESDGSRSREMLCLSEPETVAVAVKTVTEAFRSDPAMLTFGFGPPDGHPLCHCDRCQKGLLGFTGKGLGEPSLSDLWFKFVNAVAKEVKKEFPDRWILTNGYANRVRLPEGVGKLSDNIGIQSAVIQACTLHPTGDPKCWQRQDYEELLTQWTQEIPCVFVYDYDPGKSLDNLPFPALHNLKRDLPFLKEKGVWGFWTEGQNAWMTTHLNYYIRARLMWDVKQNVESLVEDYCESFYGKAAGPVERYIWRLEDAVNRSPAHATWGMDVPWNTIYSPAMVRALDSDLAAADKMADSPERRLHVRMLRLVHRHMKAYLAMEEAAAEGDFAGAVAKAGEMLAVRDEAAGIDPALIPHTPEWCRDSGFTVEGRRNRYRDLSGRTDGSQGGLVALLPRKWEFKTDPGEDGQIYRWYLPGKGIGWKEIDTALYWQAQGYQNRRGLGYGGQAWYRTVFDVPAGAKGKPLKLAFGGIYNQGLWIWVNGLLIDRRPSQDSSRPFDVDVTGHIKPGQQNSVAVLVNTPSASRSERSGLYRRAFLWSPK
ncbi:MAG: DUF4838 domain-containing protein [Armatimonadetes bacterium]|nr:DUF4838 domain-containing protein [Armatimonadota bacterium]